MRTYTRRTVTGAAILSALVAVGGLAVNAEQKKRPVGPVIAHHGGGDKIGAASARIENIKVWDHAGEPTIGINPGGDIFYATINAGSEPNGAGPGLPNQVRVFKSEDDGSSWQDISAMAGPVRRHAVSLDPYIFVDTLPDGDTSRIFNIDLTVACSYLSYSDDNGSSWTTNPLACGRPVNDHQTLFAGPPATSSPIGYPHVVYYCWNDVATSSCSRSIDGGITFIPTRPPFAGLDDSGSLCGGLHGHGVVGKDGTIYLPREYCGRPMVAISKDEGMSWTIAETTKMRAVENALLDPSVAVDDKGNIYNVFVGEKDRLPYLQYSRNDGKSWSKPVMIGVPGLKESNLATLAVGDPGKVAVAYMGSTNVEITKGEEGSQRDYDEATWNAYMTASVDVFAKDPVFVTGQVNESSDPIDRRNCGPGRCGRVFDFIDINIAPDGTAWAAFVDACIDVCALPTGIADYGDEAMAGHLTGLRLR